MMDALHILRALKAGELSLEEAKRQLIQQESSPMPPHPSRPADVELGDRYGLVLSTVHHLDELALREWVVPEPSADEMTIQVQASAINFADTLCIRGLYPTMPDYPFVPGFEVAGIVAQVGRRDAGFREGDEVMALTGPRLGGHASRVNVPLANAVHKPANIAFEDACSLPVVFTTVYYAFAQGQLAPGEHVLIQTATGGCGLIALQLAYLKGCICYGTSSREEKLAILERLGVAHAINYKTSEFDREIKRLTHERGVDVVLNMVPGDAIQRGLNCLAPAGRYLELAVHALKTSKKLDLSRLLYNQTIHSIDLRRPGVQPGFSVRDVLTTMVELLRDERIVPIVSRVYPVQRIGEALAYVAEGRHIGKVVISHTREDMVDRTEQCIQDLVAQKRRADAERAHTPCVVAIPHRQQGRGADPRLQGIAIVGISGQFPMAPTVVDFWENVARGRDCISEIPPSRWPLERFYDPDPKAPGKTYSKWMGVLEDIDKFDPLFFSISPAEAELMDPQQRLFLENCWHCIEDAGLSPTSLSGRRCGVFVGCAPSDYGQFTGQGGLNAQGLLGGSTSILSARISYLLNLKGPCLSIDTACSASLVAVAQACDSLILGDCDLALAGGVCIMPGPGAHIMTSKAGMLSKDGRCFTFDQRANGFVPGEGVGVVLLKRLADAVRDRHPIYGVIRGWGVNQDGKTNGITAPSVTSQISLETEVYRRFGIDPGSISLVEAHGTGTKLGDPIEVEALTEAFRAFTRERQFCALGSVKSNIGHLLAAAGVSGLIKVLMALKHQMLPPTINFETLNEHIDLRDSPFYINTELKPWRSTPRRAAISTFGFSGTNAHIVVEEYLAEPETAAIDAEPHWPMCVVLSARTEERLAAFAALMREFLEATPDLNLQDLAYTLQVGREAMDHRLAICARSRQALLEGLAAFTAQHSVENLLVGQVRKSKGGTVILDGVMDSATALQPWLEAWASGDSIALARETKRIAALWVQGLEVDWQRLYDAVIAGGGRVPRRISLPGYPFAHERCWIPDISHLEAPRRSATSFLHPLVHRNTSTFFEQRFSSLFSGEEFFLADHVIDGRRFLPGVAYLEMARAAFTLGLGEGSSDASPATMRLTDVVWMRPVIVGDEPVALHIRLAPDGHGRATFEVYTQAGAEAVIHCRGAVALVLEDGIASVPRLNLDVLRAQCSRGSLSREQCYQAFQAMHICYGPGQKGIEALYRGTEHGATRVLAKLALPEHLRADLERFTMHPCLLDSALQAVMGFAIFPFPPGDANVQSPLPPGGEEGEGHPALATSSPPSPQPSAAPALPFAVERVDILGPCTPTMWALLQEVSVSGGMRKLDVDLCDEAGAVRVRISGYTSRVMEERPKGRAETDHVGPSVAERPPRAHPLIDSDASGPGERAFAKRFSTRDSILRDHVFDGVCILPAAAIVEMAREAVARTGARPRRLTNFLVGYPIVGTEHGIDTRLLLKPTGERIAFTLSSRDQQSGRVLIHSQGTIETGARGHDGDAGMLDLDAIRARLHHRADLEHDYDAVVPHAAQFGPTLRTLCEFSYGEGEALAKIVVGEESQSEALVLHPLIIDGAFQAGAVAYYHRRQRFQPSVLFAIDCLEMFAPTGDTAYVHLNLRDAGQDSTMAFDATICDGAGRILVRMTQVTIKTVALDRVPAADNVALRDPEPQAEPALQPRRQDSPDLFHHTEAYLKAAIAKVVKIPVERLDVHEDFGKYGIDSLTVMRLNDLLSEHFDSLPRTLFFEYLTVHELTAYFVAHHAERLEQLFRQPIAHAATSLSDAMPPTASPAEQGKPTHAVNAVPRPFLRFTKRSFFGQDADPEALLPLPPGEGHTRKGFSRHDPDSGAVLPLPPGEGRGEGGEGTKKQPQRAADGGGSQRPPTTEPRSHDVAIVGLAGRYPGAERLSQFWENLKLGRDCITEIPAEAWDYRAIYDPQGTRQHSIACKWGGFIKDADKFDPLFFHISPREAETLDPQARIFLEAAWHCVEDAGYAPRSFASMFPNRNVGVFVGVSTNEYQLLRLPSSDIDINGVAYLFSVANRVSYHLGLHGPSLSVDTACSSSLSAIHMACKSIIHGECEAAIAGGVTLSLHPHKYQYLSKGHFLASDGRCRSFGAGGDGYVPGEGVGAVLLKPLHRAVQDGDHIYGVIKGSAMNHGGKTSGFTVPNPKAQAQVVKAALRDAGIDPRTINYVEAHGTGTELGDPIEIAGLAEAFSDATADRQFCAIGSCKSNIGHLEAAAGIAQLTKVLLQMKHRQLAPSIHTQDLNPHISFESTPFYVQRELSPWESVVLKRDGGTRVYPRRAGISSFGVGGTNVHVIVEAYEPLGKSYAARPRQPWLLVLSAANEERLRTYAGEMADFLAHANERHESTDADGIERELVTMVCGLVDVPETEIDKDVALSDLGLDAITLAAFAERLNERYGLQLTATVFTEFATIATLAGYLRGAQRGMSGSTGTMPDTSRLAHPDPLPEGDGERVDLPVREAIDLRDLAYTLHMGREALEERLAVIVSSIGEAVDALKRFGAGERTMAGLYRGNARKDKAGLRDSDTECVADLLHKRALGELARLWVAGLDIDWRPLYGAEQPSRLSLPTYPFARERYWLPQGSEPIGRQEVASVRALHPLLQRNTSDFYEMRFSTTFSGREFFLADHRIQGRRILPGVAYLEMARAAVTLAHRGPITSIRLLNVVWARPFAVVEAPGITGNTNGSEPNQIHIRLSLAEDGTIGYEIYGDAERLGDPPPIYSQGYALVAAQEDHAQAPGFNLEVLRRQCDRRPIGAAECYQALKGVGLDYGPGHQGIEALYIGSGCVLARLRLPVAVAGTLDEFVLHPSLMDAALQASIALSGSALFQLPPPSPLPSPGGRQEFIPGPALPFALDELEVFAPCTPQMWAVVRYSDGSGSGDTLQKLDIDLCDDHGQRCVSFRGLACRVLKPERHQHVTDDTSPSPSEFTSGGAGALPPLSLEEAERGRDRDDTPPSPQRGGRSGWGGRRSAVTPTHTLPNQEAGEMISPPVRGGGGGKGQEWTNHLSKKETGAEENFGRAGPSEARPGISDFGTLLMAPTWRAPDRDAAPAVPTFSQHLTIFCEPADLSRDDLDARLAGMNASCLVSNAPEEDIAARVQAHLTRVFEEVRAILRARPHGPVLVQVVVPGTAEEQRLFAAISALLKTAHLENPHLIGQLIEVQDNFATWCDALAERLQENRQRCRESHVRYHDGKRLVAAWESLGALPSDAAWESLSVPWKDDGVYLITGGAGGLGLLFAEEIARQTRGATMILVGRSLLASRSRDRLAALRARFPGVTLEYRQVDVAHTEAVAGLVRWLRRTHGNLHGIIHAAGVRRDNFILKKSTEELHVVLAPKVAGLVNLDHASRDCDLDFLVLCSSGAAAEGNAGQADYAAANAFMDAYATYRNHLAAAGRRRGWTLSVNWPLWQEGGMRVDQPTEDQLRRMGLVPIATQAAFRALYRGLASGRDQVWVLEGDLDRLQALFEAGTHGAVQARTSGLLPLPLGDGQGEGVSEPAPGPGYPHPNPRSGGEGTHAFRHRQAAYSDSGPERLRDKAVTFFRTLLAAALKLPAERVEADVPLEHYGIDSILVVEMNKELEKVFGSLSKTLFFEYQNLGQLTDYFLKAHPTKVQELLGIVPQAPLSQGETAATQQPNWAAIQTLRRDFRGRRRVTSIPLTGYQEVVVSRRHAATDIAVIGLAGRYAMADTIEEFWTNLKDGRDCITEIPSERWNHDPYFDADRERPGKTYGKWGGFLNGVDRFDALFFNISPREAELMDPQERLFLECAYAAIEDAGYTRATLAAGASPSPGTPAPVGVFVGVMYEEYQLYGAQEQAKGRLVALPGSPSSVANRVSYFCNFSGPSLAVDTMCSSSLTAIHLACESLKRGECELAIAGGVNVSIHPNKYLLLAQGRFLSSKGRCESFGAGGDGYVPGEGVGAVLLKPLAQAIADGDHIYGIIKGSAINHGGKTNGYSVPNPHAQAQVIRAAFKQAGVDPRTVSYLEAHGTGTSLGDPIEIAALAKAFGDDGADTQFCAIGSVKSNIGHGESAAGIAGVTKVLLQLKHRQLVASLHSETLNPYIDFASSPFYVPQTVMEWRRPVVTARADGDQPQEYPRIAGVSSFGAGGSNAHVVLEEYVPDAPAAVHPSGAPALIPLSAKNEERLMHVVANLHRFLTGEPRPDLNLAAVAYTLQVGREAMEERLALIVSSLDELAERLGAILAGRYGGNDLYRGTARGRTLPDKDTLTLFAADEDLQAAVDAWIAKGKYDKVLSLWVKGLTFDWRRLYGTDKPYGAPPRRISLPTYPFDRQRYWVPPHEDHEVTRQGDALADHHTGLDARMLETPQQTPSIGAVGWSTAPTREQLLARTTAYFTAILASVLKMSADRIQVDTPMEEFGLDSVMVMQLTIHLEKTFGPLSKTLFFEHANLQALSEYFVTAHGDKLAELFGAGDDTPASNGAPPDQAQTATETRAPALNFGAGAVPASVGNRSSHLQSPAAPHMHPLKRGSERGDTDRRTAAPLDIAIIGLAGRYPGAKTLAEFWHNLRDGKDCITPLPEDRWSDFRGETAGIWGGFLDGVDRFDPLFFNISPVEAEYMDPQERLFLTCAYEAIEDAGYTRASLAASAAPSNANSPAPVGVFVGVMYEEYQLYGALEQAKGRPIALAGVSAAIANRVSYFCNFQGPSLAVNTMCSSSLTAIHLACQSLKLGECELAIAGGVNVSVHPNKFLGLGQGKYLSSKGRCQAFGAGGDGYVPGEGVGAVLLRPLAQAIACGDHIYGVIKASAVNHGAKSNGYTVPNPTAQANVIGRAFVQAGIDPRTLSYLEAHGTGTALGDPIEIAALTKAVRAYTEDQRFCAIGSVKSNIGHGEGAAGIAGLTKVLLQLQHRQLVPSLHTATLNPNIDFEHSPFVVQRELAPWERPVIVSDGRAREHPRRAGVSSFGAGGSNAHLVIEEYIPEEGKSPGIGRGADVSAAPWPALIVLSAKNHECLREQARRLLTFITAAPPGALNLADVAYTLQVGREAMPHRLALIATSLDGVIQKLSAFLRGDSVDGLFCGQAADRHGGGTQPRPRNRVDALATAEEATIDAWLAQGVFAEVLARWVQGMEVDWHKLYGEEGTLPHRISLPTYPFAEQRYWIPRLDEGGDILSRVDDGIRVGRTRVGSFRHDSGPNAGLPLPPGDGRGEGEEGTKHLAQTSERELLVPALHPMLHRNTSTLAAQRFSSTFTGREFFLADHVVQGRRVLPGVAYLEMARAAAAFAMQSRDEKQEASGLRLKNVVWMKPMVVGEGDGQSVEVHVKLFPEDDGRLDYEIYSQPQLGVPVIHSQGCIVIGAATLAPHLDLAAVQAQCSDCELRSEECYPTFQAMGIEYGPAHRAIETLYIGSGQVLAKLVLPADLADRRLVLHPSMLDAALQASIGLTQVASGPTSSGLTLPFAVDEVEVYGGCTAGMWAYVRDRIDAKAGGGVRKLDIDICDDTGAIRVRMKGVAFRGVAASTRALPRQGGGEIDLFQSAPGQGMKTLSQKMERAEEERSGALMLKPYWQERNINAGAAAPEYAQHLAIVCELSVGQDAARNGTDGRTTTILQGRRDGMRWLYLQAGQGPIEGRFQTYALQTFEEIRRILESRPRGRVLIQLVVPNRGEGRLCVGLAGLLKTATLENPHLISQVIEVDEEAADLAGILAANARCPLDQQISYRDEKRLVASWREVQAALTSGRENRLPWRDRGVYLITGGAGGLGLIFAEDIVRQARDATVILAGRSAPDERTRMLLEVLTAMGSPGTRVEYRRLDVAQPEAVTRLVRDITDAFGGLHGVLHSAGVTRDNFILKKAPQDLAAVLAPKVAGCVNLDRACQDRDLDLFVLFSSIAGAVGNPGQADYAAANAFMDAYAQYRNTLVSSHRRRGRTLSINWPLWREGGMRVDPAMEALMRQNTGLVPMATATGLAAFYRALDLAADQVMVLEGDTAQVRRALGLASGASDQIRSVSTPDERERADEAFYRQLSERIRNGELSAEQVEQLILASE
ncbi:MAG TPA: SDR family NAD(P)-dependent oxidoreductase [Alphaproteobacteria bacterium]|nr:SDR family NAD(P)-dependent oxidoreductase [Alphaproteobacteria bacterium]